MNGKHSFNHVPLFIPGGRGIPGGIGIPVGDEQDHPDTPAGKDSMIC